MPESVVGIAVEAEPALHGVAERGVGVPVVPAVRQDDRMERQEPAEQGGERKPTPGREDDDQSGGHPHAFKRPRARSRGSIADQIKTPATMTSRATSTGRRPDMARTLAVDLMSAIDCVYQRRRAAVPSLRLRTLTSGRKGIRCLRQAATASQSAEPITVSVTTFAALGASLMPAHADSTKASEHEWGPVEVVADKVGAEYFGPLFVLPNGDSVLTWIDYRGPLRSSVRSAESGAWGQPVTLSGAGEYPSTYKALELPDGRVIVYWLQSGDGI